MSNPKDNRFTDRAKRILFLAREEARRMQHDYVGTEHILLAIIREGEGVATAVLLNLGITTEPLKRRVEDMVPPGGGSLMMGDLPYNASARRAMEFAVEEARNLQHNYVGTEHLLLGLLDEPDGIANRALNFFGVDNDRVRSEILRLLAGEHQFSEERVRSALGKLVPPKPAGPAQFTLDAFG